MNYTKSTTNKQTTMTKLMRWEHFRKQGIAVLYVFENNDWIKYTESKFYTTDEPIAWVVPNSKGFATAQVLLKNGYTEVQAKIHS